MVRNVKIFAGEPRTVPDGTSTPGMISGEIPIQFFLEYRVPFYDVAVGLNYDGCAEHSDSRSRELDPLAP